MIATTLAAPPLVPIQGPTAWRGTDYLDNDAWILRLTPTHVDELASAAAEVQRQQLSHRQLDASNFPLPTLGPVLTALRETLHHGRGFSLVKGIKAADYDLPTLKAMMVGLGTHLGIPVSQSFRGDYLGEVRNYQEPGNERPYRGGGQIDMHRDPCDIVGLLCHTKAMQGGASRLASAATVWNLFLTERPDLLEPLIHGFKLYLTKDDRASDSPVTPFPVPVFTLDPDNALHCTFIAELAEGAVAKGGESWSPHAQEAIAYFRHLSNRAGVCLDMQIEEGDIQLLNNRATVHGRTDYQEWPQVERRRLMLRLWLMCPDWPQPLSAVNRILFGKTDRADGGVAQRAA